MYPSLIDFFENHHRVVVLTGAGVSTASGIPDYRDETGAWKHRRPMEYGILSAVITRDVATGLVP